MRVVHCTGVRPPAKAPGHVETRLKELSHRRRAWQRALFDNANHLLNKKLELCLNVSTVSMCSFVPFVRSSPVYQCDKRSSSGSDDDARYTCGNNITAPWLILPVVICLSQRLSHACLSTSQIKVKPRKAH